MKRHAVLKCVEDTEPLSESEIKVLVNTMAEFYLPEKPREVMLRLLATLNAWKNLKDLP